MIKCLYCEEEFEPKRETAKYCSDSCRVMYNRKYGKKNVVTKFQMQTLYNEIRSMVNDLNKPTNQIKPQEQPKTNYFVDTTPKPIQPQMSQEGAYIQELRDAKTISEIQAISAAIKADTLLPQPTKNRLQTFAIDLSKNMYND
jgi:hypothetical protein